MKKILCLITAIFIVMSVATGCDIKTQQQGTSSGSTEMNSGSDGGTEKTYSEKMTINWASVQVKEGTDYNGDEFTKLWTKKFNIEWNMIPLTWDNWAEKLRIWINSGDMPDVATWDYKHGEYATYVEQELIRKLPDDWKSRWTNVAGAFESTVIGPKLDELFGGTYGLPKPRFAMNKPCERLPNHMGIYMRRDWMEQLGIEIKDGYTINEIMDIARQIKKEDPGKVGGRLVPIEIRTENMSLVFPFATHAHSQYPADFYKGADGKYRWGPADNETLEGLKLYKQAFQEGLLHPEFYTLKQNEDIDDFFVAGNAAITCEGGLGYYQNLLGKSMEENLGLDPEKALHFACVLGNDGKFYSPEMINYWTFNLFSPDMKESKFERIMDIFEYSCTEEGQLSLRMGIKGTDWVQNEDGSFKTLLPAGETVDTKYDSIMPLYINMLVLSDDFDMINPSYNKLYRDRTKKQYELRDRLSDDISLAQTDWNAVFHDSPSHRKVFFEYAKEYAQLILKDGDIEENWRAWVNEKMQLVQPVLDELDNLK